MFVSAANMLISNSFVSECDKKFRSKVLAARSWHGSLQNGEEMAIITKARAKRASIFVSAR